MDNTPITPIIIRDYGKIHTDNKPVLGQGAFGIVYKMDMTLTDDEQQTIFQKFIRLFGDYTGLTTTSQQQTVTLFGII